LSDNEYNPKMIAAKQKLLERFRGRPEQTEPEGERPRLPPGQHLTRGFPVLDLGVRPPIHLASWTLEVDGVVETPLRLTWEEFRALPRVELVRDFHCVTTWSRYDVRWAGVSFRVIAERAGVKAAAKFVVARGGEGYTTNIPLEDCLRDDVLLADELEGEPLPLEHGGPVRLLVPHLYGWKSCKFLRGLRFTARDEPGYWEVRGYHNYGDPWREQRYGGRFG
jgi:DMSO/TMAO reductase YedYZ molybdopterin-dependent catalytic subunit